MTMHKIAVVLALALTVFTASKGLASASECPLYGTRGWVADVLNDTKADTFFLVVSGQVDTPTPGFTFEWAQGPTDRRNPPTVVLRVVPSAPDGLALQAVQTEEISYRLVTKLNRFRSVRIVCADRTLVEIIDVK